MTIVDAKLFISFYYLRDYPDVVNNISGSCEDLIEWLIHNSQGYRVQSKEDVDLDLF